MLRLDTSRCVSARDLALLAADAPMRISELARIAGCSRTTVYRIVSLHRVATVDVLGTHYRPSDVLPLLAPEKS